MKRWYVVQVYAGYENLVKKDIEKRVEESGMADVFGQILIPSAKLKTLFDAISQEKNEQQLFPGYLLIEMELTPQAIRLVQKTPKVSKLLGGTDPVPLSKKEIDRIISQVKGEVALAPKKSEFVPGAQVEVADGAFAGFVGVIDRVDEENERLSVMVSIFGRMTPIELRFDQVKR